MATLKRKVARPADVNAALEAAIARLAEKTGYKVDDRQVIPPDMTFRQWCEQLGRDGLKVDGFPFTLENRPSMWFIYDLIPCTAEEAFGRIVTIMKCAQVGFTVMEMLAAIYMALKFEPCRIGMYLPDMKLAAAKSSERFMPIIRTVPLAYSRMTMEAADGSGRKKGEGNVMIRNMGESRFHFLWTSGKATTESFPMDVLSFDEVQEMAVADMEKTRERLSASRIRFTLMGSTANWPDRDIHWWFKKGTQHQFHTRCPHCQGMQVMDEHFPQCIKFDEDRHDYRYVCVHCGGWIDDPQQGEWIAKNPGAEFNGKPHISVHYPQFLSPTISPREIIEAYFNADDMKNFYNRKLGKPYTDPSQVPVNLEHLNRCAEEGVRLGLQWLPRATETFMGIDQMGAFNVHIIKRRLPDGRQAVVHLEYTFDNDPFARSSELMDLYGVQVCVVETLPNYNDAKRFALRHPGRVFLAAYMDLKDDMLRWGDAPKLGVSERRTSEDERDRYTVMLDQYKCMQVSMARLVKTQCLFPDPDALEQEVIEKGMKRLARVCREYAFLHFTRTALVAEKDEEQKKFRRKVMKVGIDPHTSYANMLCDVAWARAHGTNTIILPEVRGVSEHAKKAEAMNLHGLPTGVAAMIEELPAGQVCGRCSAFDPASGRCAERELLVRPQDQGCMLFLERGS